MRVEPYIRVSTEKQIENYSIPLQKERLNSFYDSKGWNDIKEYIDPGYSGANLNRPALEQLQKDIKNKIFTKKVFCGNCGEEYSPYAIFQRRLSKKKKSLMII